ncbi:Predicted transcriptional regulator [bacterium JGI 053]|nr:Predicted transcriptional regulator [bacterium JGI 053]
MKELHRLTELQIEVLGVLWQRSEATVADVHQALEPSTGLARKTIGTLLFRLEQQGVIRHREEGREYLYAACVTREQVERAAVGSVLGRLFRGDVAAMVSHALRAEEVEPGDVERLKEMLERWTAEREEP